MATDIRVPNHLRTENYEFWTPRNLKKRKHLSVISLHQLSTETCLITLISRFTNVTMHRSSSTPRCTNLGSASSTAGQLQTVRRRKVTTAQINRAPPSTLARNGKPFAKCLQSCMLKLRNDLNAAFTTLKVKTSHSRELWGKNETKEAEARRSERLSDSMT